MGTPERIIERMRKVVADKSARLEQLTNLIDIMERAEPDNPRIPELRVEAEKAREILDRYREAFGEG